MRRETGRLCGLLFRRGGLLFLGLLGSSHRLEVVQRLLVLVLVLVLALLVLLLMLAVRVLLLRVSGFLYTSNETFSRLFQVEEGFIPLKYGNLQLRDCSLDTERNIPHGNRVGDDW